MSVGKYSPTVSSSYSRDQKWWERNGGGYGNGTNPDSNNDNDGFDSYGYAGDGLGPDRAGHTEDEYLSGGEFDEDTDEYGYPLYESIQDEWCGRLLGDLDQYRGMDVLAEMLYVPERTLRMYIYEFGGLSNVRHIGRGFTVDIHTDDLEKVAETLRSRVPGVFRS